ncbi:MAG: hypothetical protein NT062_05140 [Proteobacteria bacterium]|nr:hypothetical protein [Pseudomonadota bacterium]
MPPALVSVASSWSCAFDVVEAHPAGLNADDVGEVLGVVGARVGQLERKALAELNAGLRELHGIDSATLEREARLRERREASGAKPESRLTLTPTERRAMSLATGGRREDRAARRARRQQARAAQLAADAGNTGDLPVLADGISTPPTTNENLHA